MEMKYHINCDIVWRCDTEVVKIMEENNLTDSFRNTLPARTFENHVKGLGARLTYIDEFHNLDRLCLPIVRGLMPV